MAINPWLLYTQTEGFQEKKITPDEEQRLEEMIAVFTAWGYTKTELRKLVEDRKKEIGRGHITAEEAVNYLGSHFEQRFGKPIKEEYKYGKKRWMPKWIQAETPAAAQARAVMGEMLGEGIIKPHELKEGYVKRPQSARMFPAEAITETWPGLRGREPGTIVTDQAIRDDQGRFNPQKMLKLIKDWQRGAVYEQPSDIIRTEEGKEVSIQREFPTRFGKESPRKDTGFVIPTAHVLKEVLPEGVKYMPKGFIEKTVHTRVKTMSLPDDFEVEDLQMHEVWDKNRRVIPFKGAKPIELGLGKRFESAELVDYEELEERDRYGKRQIQLIFKQEAGLSYGAMASKSFADRYMLQETDTRKMIPGIHLDKDFAVSEIKRPTMIAAQYWGGKSLYDWATGLGDIKFGEADSASKRKYVQNKLAKLEADELTWSDVSRDLTSWFQKYMVERTVEEGGMYTELDMTMPIHRSELKKLKEARSGIEVEEVSALDEDIVLAIFKNVPMLVTREEDEGMFTQLRKENVVKDPRLGYADMKRIREVSPVLYEDLLEESAGGRAPYVNLISAHQLSSIGGKMHVRASEIRGAPTMKDAYLSMVKMQEGSVEALLGSLVHERMEKNLKGNKDFETEQWVSGDIGGVSITGQLDVYDKDANEIIDFKAITSTDPFSKYKYQLLAYAKLKGAERIRLISPSEVTKNKIRALRDELEEFGIVDGKLDEMPLEIQQAINDIADDLWSPDKRVDDVYDVTETDFQQLEKAVSLTALKKSQAKALISKGILPAEITTGSVRFTEQLDYIENVIAKSGYTTRDLERAPVATLQLPKEWEVLTPTKGEIEYVLEKAYGKFDFNERVDEGRVIHEIISEAAKQWGERIIQLAPDVYLPGMEYMRDKFTHSELEGYEMSRMGRAAARSLAAAADMQYMGGEDERDPASILRGLKKVMGEVATGEEGLKKGALSVYSDKMYGAAAYAEPLLNPNEIVLPEEVVLEKLGLEGEEAQKFIAEWKAGKKQPTGLVWGHPIPGTEVLSRAFKYIHPDVIKRRAGEEAPHLEGDFKFAISETLARALGRDFDADLLWSLLVDDKYDIPIAEDEEVDEWARRRMLHGRPRLMRAAELSRPPKWRPSDVKKSWDEGELDKEWDKLTDNLKLSALLDPDNLEEVGTEELTTASKLGMAVGGNIAVGQYHNLAALIRKSAREHGHKEAGEALFEHIHGRAQGPVILPTGLIEAMQWYGSATVRGSRTATPIEQLEEGFTEDAGWRGFGGRAGLGAVMRGIMHGMMTAEIGDEDSPEMEEWIESIAKLGFHDRDYEDAELFIRRYRGMTTADQAKALSELAGSGINKWMRETSLGQAISGLMIGRSGGADIHEAWMHDDPELAARSIQAHKWYSDIRSAMGAYRFGQDPDIMREVSGQEVLLTEQQARDFDILVKHLGDEEASKLMRRIASDPEYHSRIAEQIHSATGPVAVRKYLEREVSEVGQPAFREPVGQADVQAVSEGEVGAVGEMGGVGVREQTGLTGEQKSIEELRAVREQFMRQGAGVSKSAVIDAFSRVEQGLETYVGILSRGIGEITSHEAGFLKQFTRDYGMMRAFPFAKGLDADIENEIQGLLETMGAGEFPLTQQQQRVISSQVAAVGAVDPRRLEIGRAVEQEQGVKTVELLTSRLSDLSDTVKEVDQRMDEGLTFTKDAADAVMQSAKAWSQLEKYPSHMIGEEAIRMGKMAGEVAMRLPHHAEQITAEKTGMQLAGDITDHMLEYMTNYWSMYRIQRAWGMTGGPVFQAQQPAAQYQQQMAQAAYMATGGVGQMERPAMATHLMASQQRKAMAQRQMGIAGYEAYGAVADMMALEGTVGGIARPAIGAGLGIGMVAKGLAGVVPALSGLTMAGVTIPAAAVLGAFGAANWAEAQRAGDPSHIAMAARDMQLLESGEGTFFENLIAQQMLNLRMTADDESVRRRAEELAREEIEAGGDRAMAARRWLGTGQRPAGITFLTQAREEIEAERERAISLIAGETDLDRIPAEYHALAIQQRAEELSMDSSSILHGLPPEAIAAAIGDFTAYRDTTDIADVTEQQIMTQLTFGMGARQFAQMARQMRMPSGEMLEGVWHQLGPRGFEEAVSLYQQHQYRLWDESPETLMRTVTRGLQDESELVGMLGSRVGRATARRLPMLTPRQESYRDAWESIRRQAEQYGQPMDMWDPERPEMSDPEHIRRVGSTISTAIGMADRFGIPVPAVMSAFPEAMTDSQSMMVGQVLAGRGTMQQVQAFSELTGIGFDPQLATTGPGGMRMGVISPTPFGMTTPQWMDRQAGAQARLTRAQRTGDFIGGWDPGSLWGIQDQMTELSLAHSRSQAGAQIASIQAQIAHLQELWPIQDQMIQLGHVQRVGGEFGDHAFVGSFNWQMQNMMRQRDWTQRDLGLQRAGLALSREQLGTQRMYQMGQLDFQRETAGLQYGRGLIERDWTRDDWTRQMGISSREFGWQMEDYEEAIRFATGREREQLIRRQERDVIRYAEDRTQFETEKQRQEERWSWQDEDHERQLQQLEERAQYEEQMHEYALRRLDLQEERLNLQEEKAAETHEMNLAQLEEQRLAYELMYELQAEERELTREHQMEQLERQMAQAGAAAAHAEAMAELQEKYKNAQRAQEALLSNWENQMIRAAIKILEKWDEELARQLEREYFGFITSSTGVERATDRKEGIEER